MRSRPLPFTLLLVGIGVVLAGLVLVHSIRGTRDRPEQRPVWTAAGDPARGREAIERHGCGACHVIDGVPRARGRVGPKLEGLEEQAFIAGVLPNSPDNLAAWIVAPSSHAPRTAMPTLDVTEEEARDIAAYLLRRAIRAP